jgi:hypothetical protein
MSVGIYIREVDMNGYLAREDGKQLSLTLADGIKFPNIHAAKEAHAGFRHNTIGFRMEMVAADPDRPDLEPKSMGELDDLEEIAPVPLKGALELYAQLKKSSKYFHQFQGAQKVTHIIPPSLGDHYCFRVAHNAYRHEDLVFSVKVGDEFVRLDKWSPPKNAPRTVLGMRMERGGA